MVLWHFDIFFIIMFTLEVMVKVAALGAVEYIYDPWNQLDVFIVAVGFVGIGVNSGTNVSSLRTLRRLPLRWSSQILSISW